MPPHPIQMPAPGRGQQGTVYHTYQCPFHDSSSRNKVCRNGLTITARQARESDVVSRLAQHVTDVHGQSWQTALRQARARATQVWRNRC